MEAIELPNVNRGELAGNQRLDHWALGCYC